MRWDNLSAEAEEARSLPGYREPATVRTFDAPEALDTRFYEVRARSALNRVPKASQVPFRWTINPYRGCTHSCTYCSWGETPILMGDGRTKPLADVRAGDYVYGTVRRGRCRRYSVTQVQAQWSTIKPAYRITLEDGTELVASGDHRFLTDRGWRHVADTGRCRQRAHLTQSNNLIGTGQFADAPDDWRDYRRGYLCGLVRGDAHPESSEQPRGDGTRQRVNRFRLALTDLEALRRAKEYLEDERAVLTQEFALPTLGRRSTRAIRTQTGDDIARVTELLEWPRGPRPEWCKGFLAGIFDAQGSFSGSLRTSNTDPEIIDWVCSSLRQLGFLFVIEDPRLPDGLRHVRLLGGLTEHLRFFHTVDPAVTRKRELEGIALENPDPARLRVVSIEPLGRGFRLYDITTGTGDFIANGVVSHNCFARPTHKYLDFDAGRDFEREIVVKVNVPEVARAELMRPSWSREHVAMGTNTDPYQWVEGRYRLMPGIWEAMRDSATPCSILTKSPLLLRDRELLLEVAQRAPVSANLSVPTIDERAWRATEPRTPNPLARLEAVAELNRIGIPTGILIAPLMPGVNDDPAQVERILELAAEAGAVHVGGIALHLRGEVKDLWFDWLRMHRPELAPRYERLYARGAYASPEYRRYAQGLTRSAEPRPRRYIAESGSKAEPAPRDARSVELAADEASPPRSRQATLF